MAIAPNNYQGRVVAPGDALVVDQGNYGPKEIWRFSPETAEGESLIYHDKSTLSAPQDITIGKESVYLVDGGVALLRDAPRNSIYRLQDDRSLTPIPTSEPFASNGIAIDPITGDLFVLDAGRNRLLRVKPATGVVSEVVTGFLGLKWAGVDVSPDGRKIFITDTADGAIFTFTRD